MKLLSNHLSDRGFDPRSYAAPLLHRRLVSRVRALGARSVSAYVEGLAAEPGEEKLLYRVLFGESDGFTDDTAAWEHLANGLSREVPPHMGEGERALVWCAGCGTGEEVHCLALVLAEAFGVNRARALFEIVGTDVIEDALAVARAASYSELRVMGLSQKLVARYFRRAGEYLVVDDDLRALSRFERHDLVRDEPKRCATVIVSRRVLELFSKEGRVRAIACFAKSLEDHGGLLLVGPREGRFIVSSDLLPASTVADPRSEHPRLYSPIRRVA